MRQRQLMSMGSRNTTRLLESHDTPTQNTNSIALTNNIQPDQNDEGDQQHGDESNNGYESDEARLLRFSIYTRRHEDSAHVIPGEVKQYWNENLEGAYSLLMCRNGQGLSRTDTDRILAVFSDPRFDLSKFRLKSWVDLDRFCQKLQESLLGAEVPFSLRFLPYSLPI